MTAIIAASTRNLDAKETLKEEPSRIHVPSERRLKEEQSRQVSLHRFGWVDTNRFSDKLAMLLLVARSCLHTTNCSGSSGTSGDDYLNRCRQLSEERCSLGGPRPPELSVFGSATRCCLPVAQKCS